MPYEAGMESTQMQRLFLAMFQVGSPNILGLLGSCPQPQVHVPNHSFDSISDLETSFGVVHWKFALRCRDANLPHSRPILNRLTLLRRTATKGNAFPTASSILPGGLALGRTIEQAWKRCVFSFCLMWDSKCLGSQDLCNRLMLAEWGVVRLAGWLCHAESCAL